MGCWNATCMLTRLPILSGEPCLAVLMVPADPDYRNMTDPAGMYMPFTPLICGDYNDYGCLEYIRNLDEIKSCLEAVDFRIRRQGGEQETLKNIGNISDRLRDDREADLAISDIMEHANRCELEAFVDYAGGRATWKPVYLALMKKPFAEMLIQNSMDHVAPEDMLSITFRLKTAGPLQAALRRLDPRYGIDEGPALDKNAAIRMLAFFNGLITMRIAFAPQCGAGGQDAMDEPWQLDFYLKAWAASETMARRYSEDVQEPFYAMSSWDGYNLTMRPGTAEEPREQPVETSDTEPDDIYQDLLEHAARNLTTAMDLSQARLEE